MRTPTRLSLYGVALLVAFGTALGAGRVVGPSSEAATNSAEPAGHGDEPAGHEATGAEGHDGNNAATHVPRGLQVSEGGYRLVPDGTGLTAGAATGFRFRILGPDGLPVTRYTPTHERDLHLIVVRRDLSGFQHLHPVRADDGTWSIPLTVAAAGPYRVFADFQPAGRDEPLTLGVDATAAGIYEPTPPQADSHATVVDGYRVELGGHLEPGSASRLTLTVTKEGKPVTDLQPYLGAFGHLVALRDGDLAYLHVHPDGTPGPAGPEISFTVEVPSAGTYGLFLDFRHGDAVHTAAFTTTARG